MPPFLEKDMFRITEINERPVQKYRKYNIYTTMSIFLLTMFLLNQKKELTLKITFADKK